MLPSVLIVDDGFAMGKAAELLLRDIRAHGYYAYYVTDRELKAYVFDQKDLPFAGDVRGIILVGYEDAQLLQALDRHQSHGWRVHVHVLDRTRAATDTASSAYEEMRSDMLAFVEKVIPEKTFSTESYASYLLTAIQRQAPEGQALVALSGGVDSTVAALLVHRALPGRLKAVFVDHGFMRAGEGDAVVKTLRETLGLDVTHIDARERFLEALKGVDDPEAKRKIIGEQFIRVFEDVAKGFPDVRYLVQGTILPDVIESAQGERGVAVKSHHNVGGLPATFNFMLLEPLRQLYKDDVRALGTWLGLPEMLTNRQPFPGPGLAVRLLGAITPDKLEMLRAADAIVREEIEKRGLHASIWQYFAVLLPTRSVGTGLKGRSYGHTVAVRAVHSTTGTSAEVAMLPWDVLLHISKRITEEVPGVGRVVYDVTGKPPGTIEWE
ncbi:MAG: glutamine-hydrolyzing GMP synthase [Candidatus Carbobacillus sp.]|nr:glutamine-hydrolyzing GMP synthase [Candidatus Carbobacillus sp.]